MIYEKIPVRVAGSSEGATLYTYMLDNFEAVDPGRTRPVVVLCPGGGYSRTSDREAEPLGMRFLAAGYHVAILRYSCAPEAEYPVALMELAWTMQYLRRNAARYHIDPEKVVVQGCSAGGHLAASLGVFWNKKPELSEAVGASPLLIRPDALLLCYPVITSGTFAHRESFQNLLGSQYEQRVEEMSLENQVDGGTPPCFLWHTGTDEAVPVENSILFYSALHWEKVPCEMHIYPVGGHGLSLADRETQRAGTGFGIQKECQSWIRLALAWLGTL